MSRRFALGCCVGTDRAFMPLSIGDGLAILTPTHGTAPTRLLTVPFTLPSELCLVHIHRHEPDTLVSHADLLSIIEPSQARSLEEGEKIERLGAEGRGEKPSAKLVEVRKKFGDRVQCQYFGSCSGCQVRIFSLRLRPKSERSLFRGRSIEVSSNNSTSPSPMHLNCCSSRK